MVIDARKNSRKLLGFCVHCGTLASKEAHFHEDGAIVIEKYCQRCSEPTEFARLQEWYSRI